MKSPVLLLAVLAVVPLSDRPAHAQQVIAPPNADVFAPGTRLRISAPSLQRNKVVGTVVSRVADTLVVDTTDVAREHRLFFPSTVPLDQHRRISLPVAMIDTLQVSVGRSRVHGMVRLATKAAVFGGIALGLNYMSGTNRVNFKNFSSGFRTGAVAAGVIAAPIGFRLGQEKWTTVFGADRKNKRDQPVTKDARVIAEEGAP